MQCKRFTASLAAMSLFTMLILAACNNDTAGIAPEQTTPVSGTSAATGTDGDFADRRNTRDNIGSYDFGGETFDIVLSTEQMKELYFAETESGDLVNDAVFRRTLAIEERFNVTLEHHDTGGDWSEVSEAVRLSVSAGDNAYDLGVAHTFIGLTGLMTSGYLYDWNRLPVVDMGSPWWKLHSRRKTRH